MCYALKKSKIPSSWVLTLTVIVLKKIIFKDFYRFSMNKSHLRDL